MAGSTVTAVRRGGEQGAGVNLLDALTQGYSAALLVGSLFAIAGVAVVLAMIRVDRLESPQRAEGSQVPEISEISEDEVAAAAAPVG